MDQLQQLKGTYFAIEVNDNLDEITKALINSGYSPEYEWNEYASETFIVNHVIVYEHGVFEFHNHDGSAKLINL